MPFGVFDPREAVAHRCSGELRRIRCAEHLLKREGLLCAESPGRAQEQHNSPNCAVTDVHARMVAGAMYSFPTKDMQKAGIMICSSKKSRSLEGSHSGCGLMC